MTICISPDRWQSETLILSTNVAQKVRIRVFFDCHETVFSIAICRPTGDKWQLKTLFLAIYNPCSSIIQSLLDCRLLRVYAYYLLIIFPMKAQHFVNCRYLFWVTLELTNQNYFSQFFHSFFTQEVARAFQTKEHVCFCSCSHWVIHGYPH